MGPVELKPKPDEAIVTELESLLAMARTGEVMGLTVMVELSGARIRTYHSACDSVMSLGHLARMAAIVNRALDDVAEPLVGTR